VAGFVRSLRVDRFVPCGEWSGYLSVTGHGEDKVLAIRKDDVNFLSRHNF
jgi:hypothetical protein